MATVKTLILDCEWVCDNVYRFLDQRGILTGDDQVAEYVFDLMEIHAWGRPRDWRHAAFLAARIEFGDMSREECDELYMLTARLIKNIMDSIKVNDISELELEGNVVKMIGEFVV